MLSICVVTQQYKSVISGIGLHARNLVAGLQRDGHHVTLLTQHNQQDGPLPADVEVLTVRPAALQNSQARWISLAWRFARELRHIESTRRFDIVHFTDAREALLFAGSHQGVVGNVNDYYAAELRSLSYYRRHYVDYWKRWLYYAFVNWCEERGLPKVGAIIANSQYTARAICRAYSLDHRTVFKCFKCIDLSLYDSVPPSLRQRRSVLFVGGNMQRKGLQVLIRSARNVAAVCPDVEFWVVGKDSHVPRMEALCQDLGVERHFEFKGWLPNHELRELYRKAGVVVMPSLEEAFGVVFLEAMASGVPVVGTRVGGIPELISHGSNGLLVNSDDPEDLGQTLISLLQSHRLQAKLAKAGLRTAQRFSARNMMDCTYAVYEEVLSL